MRRTERYVVLADVVDSREVGERDAFRDGLVEALEYVNERHQRSIETAFGTIKGIDEFGGVLRDIGPVYEVISDVLNGIHPVRVRFGIARGRVDVNETADSVAEMDGPAFHRADRLLSEAESDDVYVYVDTGEDALDLLVSNNINLLLMYRDRWTERQVEIIRAYERHGTQTEAAEELDVRQQAVSQSLTRAGYNRTKQIRMQLRDALEGLYAE